MTSNEIEDKIQNAKRLSFENILSNCIDLYKKVWLKGFIVVIIMVIAAFILGLVFELLGLSSNPYSFDNGFNFDFYTYSTNITYNLPQAAITAYISITLIAAFYRMCKQADLGQKGNDDYFYFFKKEFVGKIIALSIIYVVIATVAQLLFLIPYIYAYVPLAYFSVILANNQNLSEIEIVKASFSLGTKKWLVSFCLLFVCGILGMLGIIACGVGLLFTLSIIYLPPYFVYKEVIEFEENSEIDLIGKE
ncbi:MAG: hypothetical protein JKY02_03565 [Flavobacteriaceae bacterium]|nr:hypothetical protein [Flavobacteriaceae bacterium]